MDSPRCTTGIWFYGDLRPSEDARAFLVYIDTSMAEDPHATEAETCEILSFYLPTYSHAEEWYEKFENSVPEVLTSWTTLRKHFCIKWLGTSPNILLKIPKNKPLAMSTATTTPHERAMHKHEDASHHSLPPTTNSQLGGVGHCCTWHVQVHSSLTDHSVQ